MKATVLIGFGPVRSELARGRGCDLRESRRARSVRAVDERPGTPAIRRQVPVEKRDRPLNVDIVVDGADLADGVRIGRRRPIRNETYPWRGAHSTAVNKCNGVRSRSCTPKQRPPTRWKSGLMTTASRSAISCRARGRYARRSHRVPRSRRRDRRASELCLRVRRLYPWRTTGNTIEGMMEGE